MANLLARAKYLLAAHNTQQLPPDVGYEVAFAGRSNAGKSSALNLICGQKQLARVSKTPGRTQLINLFEVPGGRFADLPGYGYAKVPREVRAEWGKLIGRYLETRETLRGIVLIMDIRHPLTDYDLQMLEWTGHRDIPTHCLLTKADKLGFGAAKQQIETVRKALAPRGPGVSAQLFSSESRQGLPEAQARLMAWLGINADKSPVVTAGD